MTSTNTISTSVLELKTPPLCLGHGRHRKGTLSHLAYWNLLHKILAVAAWLASHTVPERFSGFFVFLPKTSLHPLDPPGTPWTPPPHTPGRPGPPCTPPHPDDAGPRPRPPCPPSNAGFAECLPEVWTAFYEAARSGSVLSCCAHPFSKFPGLACAYPASPLKLVLLTVLDLCLCLCLTRVSCCGHPSIH